MTSNLGSEYILNGEENGEELVLNELKRNFRPEFINRIDEVIVFKSLTREVVYEIVDKIIKEIEHRLEDKKITLTLTEKAKDYIIEESFEPEYGARPIKRFISRNLETLIASNLIMDNIKFNSEIIVDVDENGFYLRESK